MGSRRFASGAAGQAGLGGRRQGMGRAWLVGVSLAALALVWLPSVTVASTYTVVMKYVQFSPSPLKVHLGDSIVWSNRDIVDHQVVPDSGGFSKTPIIKPGQSYATKITKSGTIGYHDGINSFMRGTLIVSSVPASTPRPTPRPTAQPTPRPTARPTATPKPTATASTHSSASPSPSAAAGASSPGPDSSASLGASVPVGSSGGSTGGIDPLLVGVAGLTLAVLAFLAGAGFLSMRQRGGTPPPPGTGGGA